VRWARICISNGAAGFSSSGWLFERDCRTIFRGRQRGGAAACKRGIGQRQLTRDFDPLGLILRAGRGAREGKAEEAKEDGSNVVSVDFTRKK
jgi:hypothetical protein